MLGARSAEKKMLDKKNGLSVTHPQFARCLMRVLSWMSTLADIASI